jgi:hypothetical protein
MKVLKILSLVITQVGGVILLLSISLYGLFKERIKSKLTRAFYFLILFSSTYLFSIFFLVPFIAKQFGRVPLPFNEKNHLRPTTRLSFLLFRNYVRPELRDIAFTVAKQLNKKYPGTKINYLEANFPLINSFSLLPHLSHNDGKKLDLSFYYRDKKSGLATDQVPSFIGYGICEGPKSGEENMPEYCEQKGFWQYNLLPKIVSQSNKNKFEFDNIRTSAMTNLFCEQNSIGMVFIEPHLKKRLGLTNSKIKFHGCHAVRHDDHIHIQLI